MARGVNCNEPDETLTIYPCLNCLSLHELLVVLVGMLAVGNGDSADLDALKLSAAKYRNISDKQLLIGLISTLPSSWFTNLTTDNLTTDFACMTCWSDTELKGVLMQQWCTYWESYVDPQ